MGEASGLRRRIGGQLGGSSGCITNEKEKWRGRIILVGWRFADRTNDEYRGQYSDATLNELESQNDGQVEGILGKVKILKDVRFARSPTLFTVHLRGRLTDVASSQPTR